MGDALWYITKHLGAGLLVAFTIITLVLVWQDLIGYHP